MILIILSCIAILSVILAFRSLKHLQKMEEVKTVTDELKKGKVIFQNERKNSKTNLHS